MSGGHRIQANFIARYERRLLNWLCARLPRWITSDLLTAIGVVGAILVFCGYIGTRFDRSFVWLATAGFVLHWFGDSLDGSLARYRRQERVRYGYFLDSTTDAVCNLIIMIGVGLSSYVRMDAALFALLGYYLLCMYVFLHYHLHGVYRLSFLAFGPTELRVGLIAMNLMIFAKGQLDLTVFGGVVSAYDVLMVGVGLIFVGVFMDKMIAGVRELRASERNLYFSEESVELGKVGSPAAGMSGQI
ncbi:MAG: CDP-alcohol phosphatidyltransferase family protein [Methylovirgula sp.]